MNWLMLINLSDRYFHHKTKDLNHFNSSNQYFTFLKIFQSLKCSDSYCVNLYPTKKIIILLKSWIFIAREKDISFYFLFKYFDFHLLELNSFKILLAICILTFLVLFIFDIFAPFTYPAYSTCSNKSQFEK